jgi:hypothetical protein
MTTTLKHHEDCRVTTRWFGRSAPFYAMAEYHCVPECPLRRRVFSPVANLQAARRYMEARYGASSGWPVSAGTRDVAGRDSGPDRAAEPLTWRPEPLEALEPGSSGRHVSALYARLVRVVRNVVGRATGRA